MHLRLALVLTIIGVLGMWGTIYKRSFNIEVAPAIMAEAPLEPQVVTETSPKLVKTETIIPQDPAPEVKVAEVPKPEPKPESNVCTRHKMHKVYIRGGRSWRCKK
jgi:hypothetical protein